ncbi:MAG: hypothetical protein P8M22_09050 [Phycisphaerales bacterium]|nr:hypothetical protein [Phycisphaerales bacterium]
MTYLTRACLLVALLTACSLAVEEKPAQFLAVLSDQSPRLVQLGTIESTGSDLLDVNDGWINIPAGDCLAVVRRGKWKPRGSRTRVMLHDGQMFSGDLVSGNQDGIKIDHMWMRELDIPLDRISLIEFRSNVMVPPGELDRVVLANGDVLSGFVHSVDDPVTIEIEREEVEEIKLPLDRVAAIAFGGESPPASWPQIWTLDGVRMSVSSASIDASGRLDMEPHEFMVGSYERLPGADEIVALVLDGNRFTPLATLPVTTINTSEARRTASRPRREDPMAPIGLTDLHLGGPARYVFQLPAGSDRFRTGLQRPRTSRRWPPPTLVVSHGEDVLWSGEFQESMKLDLPFNPEEDSKNLSIELFCGSQGPVHCGIRLVDPMVLVDPAPSP